MRFTALLFALFAGVASAAPFSLEALTDRMQAQAERDATLAAEMGRKVMVPGGSPYLGRKVDDPAKLPFYRSLGHVEFSDGFKAHAVHHAVDSAGAARLVVLVHGIVRGDTSGWQVAADQSVEIPTGAAFVGSDAGRTTCLINGTPMLSFGFLAPAGDGFKGSSDLMFSVDPYSNLIPLPERKAECRKESR